MSPPTLASSATTATPTTTLATNGGTASNGAATTTANSATLTATILSAYDLPQRDPPTCVELVVDGLEKASTGPPAQRHKDRNSFKFSRDKLEVVAPALPMLYSSTAHIRLHYQDGTVLEADYSLKQLKIHETVWLILQLEDAGAASDDDAVPPTLRLQLTLSGPYRSEVGALVSMFRGWFHVMDQMETALPKISVDPKLLLVPATPILATLVVTAPVVLGVLACTLPVALPLLVAISGILLAAAAVLAGLYASTSSGRAQIAPLVSPMVQTMLLTKAGQTMVYQTGPRPTPVQVAQAVLPSGVWQQLICCLLIDCLGSASYLLPVVGEITDLAWAPFQTVLIMALFDDPTLQSTEWLKYVSFCEEILPFTDLIPTATAGWLLQVGIPLWVGENNMEEIKKTTSKLLSIPAASKIFDTATASMAAAASGAGPSKTKAASSNPAVFEPVTEQTTSGMQQQIMMADRLAV